MSDDPILRSDVLPDHEADFIAGVQHTGHRVATDGDWINDNATHTHAEVALDPPTAVVTFNGDPISAGKLLRLVSEQAGDYRLPEVE